MINAFTVLLAFGVLAHLALAATYFAFGVGASRWAGAWLCIAWAVAIGWRLTLHTTDIDRDVPALLIWLNVLCAAVACNASMWRRASDRGWRP